MDVKVGGIIKRIYPNSRLSYVKRYGKGVINQTYHIKVDKKDLILRIFPKDFWKVKKEKHLYELIKKKTDVPIPKILATGKNYILMKKIPGKELSVNNKKLVREAGKVLAKIHSIKFPYYGWIINKEIKPKFKKWSEFIEYDINSKFRKIPSKFNSLKRNAKKILKENLYLLDIKSEPCLLHKDFHSSHIIVGNKINGIIDVEWAIAGHNELDIAKSCSWMFDNKPELEKIFLQGYGKVSKEYDERKKLYRLINSLSSLSFSYKCKDNKWCRFNLEEVKGEVSEYN